MDVFERRREITDFYDRAALAFDQSYSMVQPRDEADRQYNRDRQLVERAVSMFGKGDFVDVGAGTAYWLPHYLRNVSSATLVEPSHGMRNEILQKFESLIELGAVNLCGGDHQELSGGSFDSILLSSVIGHYEPRHQFHLVRQCRQALRAGGELLLIDSLWNDSAAKLLPSRYGYANREVSGQLRRVYKHYFLREEVLELLKQTDLYTIDSYWGDYFFWIRLGPSAQNTGYLENLNSYV